MIFDNPKQLQRVKNNWSYLNDNKQILQNIYFSMQICDWRRTFCMGHQDFFCDNKNTFFSQYVYKQNRHWDLELRKPVFTPYHGRTFL